MAGVEMMEASVKAASMPTGFGRRGGEGGDQAHGRQSAYDLVHLTVPFSGAAGARPVVAASLWRKVIIPAPNPVRCFAGDTSMFFRMLAWTQPPAQGGPKIEAESMLDNVGREAATGVGDRSLSLYWAPFIVVGEGGK
jgi:hypothetical protein